MQSLSENRLVPEVRHSCDIVLFLNIDLMFLSQTFSTQTNDTFSFAASDQLITKGG